MLVLLAILWMDRRRSKRLEDLPLGLDVDLDPLGTFAAAMQLRASGGRSWQDRAGQVFLDEEALRVEIDLRAPELHIQRRGSPELTGHGLDLLLSVQGATPAQRASLEASEGEVLRLFHAEGAQISGGVLRWRRSMGDVHSFESELPSVPEVQEQIVALKALTEALV